MRASAVEQSVSSQAPRTEQDGPSGARHVQLKQSLRGMGSYDAQAAALAPPSPAAAPVQMARGKNNVGDTGIQNEAQAMVDKGAAADLPAALEALMKEAKAAKDKARIAKIKATQKAVGARHSRQSKDKK